MVKVTKSSHRQWDHQKLLTIFTGLLVLVGFIYTVATFLQWRSMKEQSRAMAQQLDAMKADIENSKSARSADFILRFDERFDKEPYSRIKYAIENDRPVLKEHGGKFTQDDLEGYLDIFEAMHDISAKGSIAQEMLYNAYSYAVEKTHDNSEVQAYLKEIRKDDPSFYNGFEELAKAMVSAKR